MISITLVAIVLAWLVAMAYVYRFRGKARYANLRQYLRKSWPVFALPNVVLYLFTRRWARGPFVAMDHCANLAQLAQHWEVIRDEALAIQQAGSFDEARRAGSPASFDVGFRTFYKYGWSRYYLHWYGYSHASARASCPRTLQILAGFPEINAAMFTVLPPRAVLTPHADPLACSLRYHLGLQTPNSAQCFISVDGTERAWRDGEAFVFDETYLHFVRNDIDAPRLILMCDIRRPMRLPGRVFNAAYSGLARLAQTPNDARDRRGGASALFASAAPLIARAKRLKKHNQPLYMVVKWGVNSAVIAAVLGVLGGALAAMSWLLRA